MRKLLTYFVSILLTLGTTFGYSIDGLNALLNQQQRIQCQSDFYSDTNQDSITDHIRSNKFLSEFCILEEEVDPKDEFVWDNKSSSIRTHVLVVRTINSFQQELLLVGAPKYILYHSLKLDC